MLCVLITFVLQIPGRSYFWEEWFALDPDFREISVYYSDENPVTFMVAGACGGQPLLHSGPGNRTTRTRAQANNLQKLASANQ